MVLAFVFLLGFDRHCWTTCPRHPDPQSGRTNPFHEHGIIMFMTLTELRTLQIAIALFIASPVIATVTEFDGKWGWTKPE
jgi:hypothetical protein